MLNRYINIAYTQISFNSKTTIKMKTRKSIILFAAALAVSVAVSCSDDTAEETTRATVEPADSAITDGGEYIDPLFADGTYECYPIGTTWRNRSRDWKYCYAYEVTKDTIVNATAYKKVEVRLENYEKQVGRDYVETFDPDTVSQESMQIWFIWWGTYLTYAGSVTYQLPTHGTFFIREDHGRIYEYDQYSMQEVLFYNFNWKEGTKMSCYWWQYKLCFEGRVDELRQMTLDDGNTYDVANDVLVKAERVLSDKQIIERHATMIKTIGVTDGLFSILPGELHTYLSDFYRNGKLVYSDERLHE